MYCTPEAYARLNALGDELRFLMITSQARVHRVEQPPAGACCRVGARRWRVARRCGARAAPKCVRCWHQRADVGSTAEHPELCGRCVSNLARPAKQRRFA